MLAHNKEGKLCIEDSDGRVELDFSKLVSETLFIRRSLSDQTVARNRMSLEMDFLRKDALPSLRENIPKRQL